METAAEDEVEGAYPREFLRGALDEMANGLEVRRIVVNEGQGRYQSG
jgi:hypothetical protein